MESSQTKPKLVRITTIPHSLAILLEGQLSFMSQYFKVTAISSYKDHLNQYANKEGVSWQYIPLTRKITPFADLKAVWKLYKFLKKEKPDIIHTHTPKAGTVGMLAGWLAGVKNRLHTVAGLPLMEAQGLKQTLLTAVERMTYSCATKIYPNSKGLEQFILEKNLAKSSKIKVIGNGSSNGIDTDHFNPNQILEEDTNKLRRQLDITENDFVFVFVGRLVKDKGINELVSAFHKLSNENSHLKLLLVGPYEEELDPLNESTHTIIKTSKVVITTGFVEDVRPYFSISNALVFPSYREGFPNVVMQAGAMGLPAIVSNINGCNEIINNEENGVIVPVKDAEALYEAMHKLYLDNNFLHLLKKNARFHIVSKYNRKEMWNAILKEYKALQ